MSFLRSIARGLALAYLAFFAIWGVAFSLVLPPFQGPDEILHWISGNVRYEGAAESCSVLLNLPNHFESSTVPFNVYRSAPQGKFDDLDGIKPICSGDAVTYGNRFTYPGLSLARALAPWEADEGRWAVICFHLARLAQGLLVFLGLARLWQLSDRRGYRSGTLTILAVAVSPLFVQQSFTITSDTVVNASAIALATFFLFWDRLRAFDLAFLGLTTIVAAATKPTVLPVLLPAAVPALRAIRAGRAPNRGVVFVGAGVLSIATLAGVAAFLGGGAALAQRGEIDPARQIGFLVSHPVEGLGLLWSSIWSALSIYHVASPLGWLDAHLHPITVKTWARLFYVGFLLDLTIGTWGLRRSIADGMGRLLVCLGFITCVAASALAHSLVLYLAWTPVGAPSVEGLQPRYFFFHWILLVAGALGISWKAPVKTNVGTRGIGWVAGAIVGGFLIEFGLQIFLDLMKRYN